MIDSKNGVYKHDMRAHALAAVGGLYDGGNVRKKRRDRACRAPQ